VISLVAAAPASADYSFVQRWDGKAGAEPYELGSVHDPSAIAVSADGHVYVGDGTYGKIDKFTTGGEFVTGLDRHLSIVDMDVGPDGMLYVQTGASVIVFDEDLVEVTRWQLPDPHPGVSGKENWTAYGVHADAAGNVWVADTNYDRLLRYSAGGSLLGTLKPDHNMWSDPVDLAGDAAGSLYVATPTGGLFKLRPDGTVAKYWFVNPVEMKSIAADAAGNVFALDGSFWGSKVYVFNAAGDQSSSFGSPGSDPGELNLPLGVDLASDGSVWVASSRWINQFGGEPPPPPPSPCEREGHTTGNIDVCADDITGAGSNWTATGDVRLNGGVGVGDGPIALDDAAKEISSSSSVTVKVMRPTPVSIGSGRLHVDAVDVTDDVSGRNELARLQTTGIASIVAAGLKFQTGSQAELYLDARDGGGVILSAKPGFDLLGALKDLTTKGSFAIGVHASAGRKVRVLGGSVELGGFKIPGGWELGTLKVGYTDATDSWLFAGGGAVPWIKDKKLTIDGSLRGSKIDSLGVKLELGGTGIPLGTTGIMLDTFGGSIQGLSGGPNNPIIIKALVGGGWTKTGAPSPFNWILHIKDVTLTIDTSGGGGISGGVALVDGEGRLAKGTLELSFRISPFRASGKLDVSLNAIPLTVKFGTQAVLTSEHVTATGNVSGEIVGIEIGSAHGVLSEVGAGATVSILGVDVGYGLYWRDALSFPPGAQFIGADVDQFATVSARAAQSQDHSFKVAAGRPLLVITARGDADQTQFELVAPDGTTYGFAGNRIDSWTASYASGAARALAVYNPEPGTWRVHPLGSDAGTEFNVQEVPAIGRVKPKPIKPRTTRKHRLSKRVKKVRLAWAPTRRMPTGTRVAIYTAPKGGRPAKRLARGLRPRGSRRIPVRKLRHGVNRFTLVVSQGKTRFDSAQFPNAVWRR
jgi:hypothetical protein